MATIRSTRTINLPGGVRQRTTTRVLSIVLIPWIRPRKVFFKIEGLLPNTRHKALFDNIDVSSWVREEPFQLASTVLTELTERDSDTLTSHPEGSSNLVSDTNGIIEGSFYIPNTDNIRFRTGAREFKVRDYNALNDATAISKAFATYTAKGTLETIENEITTIRPPPPPPPVRRIDPIAQSFVVDSPEGFFATSVDVYMATKSSSVPLQVQIRPVINGTPANYPVPGAHVFVYPLNVNTSSSPVLHTASHRTRATFPAPVYLDGNQEYAVVLLAESDAYTAWTAVMKEYRVGSTAHRIMKQPSMGSFFKSQNGSTWTPDQSRDLMFCVNRASFNTGTSATAYFENVPSLVTKVTGIEVLTSGADPTVKIYHENHGMSAGSIAFLWNCPSIYGIAANAINGVDHTITSCEDLDSYVITITGATATTTGYLAATAFGTTNKAYETLFTNINQMVLPGTSIEWDIKTTSGQSVAGNETPYVKDSSYQPIDINDNVSFLAPKTIASHKNETSHMSGNKSMTLRATLRSGSEYLSPVIDTTRISSTLISNRIDNQNPTALANHNSPDHYVTETDSTNGSAAAKHVCIPITLETPAVGLKVLFAANRPATAEIELYYKTVGAGDDSPLSQTDWILATIDQELPSDDDPNTFREYVYTIDNLDEFNTYHLKFVFKSSNSAEVPVIKDIRSIALGT